jgi:hypothetical protein
MCNMTQIRYDNKKIGEEILLFSCLNTIQLAENYVYRDKIYFPVN